MNSMFRKMLYKLGGRDNSILLNGSDPDSLTPTQVRFIEWNAERLGISEAESRQRYLQSWRTLEGGHRKQHYRRFNDLSYELYQVFHSDAKAEIYSAYAFHAPMHFLRMLSYREPQWGDDDTIVSALAGRDSVDIIDYGCGLAQQSRSLGGYLQEQGVQASLTLVDIPTLRKEFLLWLGERNALPTRFLDSTPETPIPTLPEADICFATEFFEHVYDPLPYFRNIHGALRAGGLLVTNVFDHHQEFMHVSPELEALRNELDALGYEALQPFRLFRKPVGAASGPG